MEILPGSGLRFKNATITMDGETSAPHKELVVKLNGGGNSNNLRTNLVSLIWTNLGNIRLFISSGEVNGVEVFNKHVVISTRKEPEWFELD